MSGVNQTKRVLTRAYNLVRKGWTKGCLARNKYSNPVSVKCDNAVRFCALGAVERAALSVTEDRRDDVLADALTAISAAGRTEGQYWDLECYNDEDYRTVEDVLALFKRAIERVG